MTVALLAATLTLGQAPSAADYFPLRPGMRLTFEERTTNATVTTDVVGQPLEVAGVPTTPVTTFQDGREVNTAYYRVEADAISIIAYDKKAPLPMPLPVLKIPAGPKTTWSFNGPGSAEKMAEPLNMKGEAEFLKTDREIFGKKVPVLQVRMIATVGGGSAREEIEQVSLYGRGIGLIESTSTTKIGKRKVVNVLRLTKVEEPKEGG